MKKEEIIELVNKINNNPERIKRGLYPLSYKDDGGFRIVFSTQLEQFTFLPEGVILWKEAIIDQDFKGIYYWIPYAEIPKGFTTPAIKLSALHDEDSEVKKE